MILDMAQSIFAQKQETTKRILGKSCGTCSLSIQSISDKKCMGKDTTRSMEWKKA